MFNRIEKSNQFAYKFSHIVVPINMHINLGVLFEGKNQVQCQQVSKVLIEVVVVETEILHSGSSVLLSLIGEVAL